MANKTFADFLTKDTLNPLNSTDYIVGYRPATDVAPNKEIKITTQDLANSIVDYFEDRSIGADSVQFFGDNIRGEISVNDKLKEFYVASDYPGTPPANGQRLFIPYGTTIVINHNQVTTNAVIGTLNQIRNWHIEGLVQLKFASGNNWLINQPIILNHPYGQNIQIIGDTNNNNNPPNVHFVMDRSAGYSGGFDIFSCNNGNSFGLIDGITIVGDGNTSIVYAGIKIDTGATLQLGSKVQINNCKHGIWADRGASVLADNVHINNCLTGNAFYASNRAHISALQSTTDHNTIGYKAENHSQILANDTSSTYNSSHGYASYTGSQIAANRAISSNNTGSGFYAQGVGSIECYGSSASNNGRYGMEFNTGGVVNGGSNLTSSIYTNLSTWNGKSSISSSVGDLYIRTPSNNSVIFNTSNSYTQLEVLNHNAPVSHVSVTGGDLNTPPTLSVIGASNSYTPVGLKIDSGDYNKYIDLGPNVRFGKYTAQLTSLSNGISATGYISCEDSDGNIRKLLVL